MRTRSILTFDVLHVHTVKKSALPPQYHHHHVPPPSTAAVVGWKSPVPYLFGGLAAMLGLIAIALLILACSYWKLSGNFDSGENSGDGDEKAKVAEKTSVVVPNSILVIMAGDENPTFLAKPTISKSTRFGENDGKLFPNCSCSSSSSGNSDGDNVEREDIKLAEMTTVSYPSGEEKR